MHLLCSDTGVPVGFELLPANLHDLTPIHDLAQCVPTGATVYADKAYHSGEVEAWLEGYAGVRLIPVRKKNMEPNTLVD